MKAWQILMVALISASTVVGVRHFTAPRYPEVKVGDCFQVAKPGELMFEYRRVIELHRDEHGDMIRYVYNFPGEDGFKSGRWYTNPLADEYKSWFFKSYEGHEIQSVKCPW